MVSAVQFHNLLWGGMTIEGIAGHTSSSQVIPTYLFFMSIMNVTISQLHFNFIIKI